MTTTLLERPTDTGEITDVIGVADAVVARVPFLAPKFAPGTARPAPTALVAPPVALALVFPEVGTWVRITTTADGSYTGRFLSADDTMVSLREGAGFWNIDASTVSAVGTVNRTHDRPAVVVDAAIAARNEENKINRILARWP